MTLAIANAFLNCISDYSDLTGRTVECMVGLGRCFMEGAGVEEDSEEAVRWYSIAAEQGCLEAQEALGSYYYDEEDWDEAKKWYQIAAANGSEDAEGMLQDIAEEED